MVVWPPPGLQWFCTFVEDLTEAGRDVIDGAKAFDPPTVPPESKWNSGASIPSDSAYDAALPEETVTAGENAVDVLEELTGVGTELLGDTIKKAVDKVYTDAGIDPSTGFPTAPSLPSMKDTGFTLKGTAAKPSGDLGEKTVGVTTGGSIEYASEIGTGGTVLCFVGISGSNLFTYDIDDNTYNSIVNYNSAIGLQFRTSDSTRLQFQAQYGGNAGYGATGQGFNHTGSEGSTTVSVAFEGSF
tara:strand:+ start:292 stop:1020 length:729 start_codon:yes stop_codon:yes gene_type:complete